MRIQESYLLALLLLSLNLQAADASKSVDLSHIDFQRGESVKLQEGWVFHWNQLLGPDEMIASPDGISMDHFSSWTQLSVAGHNLPPYGYGTYHTQLILPGSDLALSLHLPKINSSAKVWINDEMVYEVGKVAKSAESVLHRRAEAYIPLGIGLDTVQITIQVANFYHRHGGITKPISIGETASYWLDREYNIISDMILIGCLFFMGISLLFLYAAYWTNDQSVLYLSIFCLCWGYRNLSDEYAVLIHVFEQIRWVWLVKIEYLSLFIGSYMGLQYLTQIFKRNFSETFTTVLRWSIMPFVILTILLPGLYLSYLLLPFFVCGLSFLLYVMGVLMTSGRNNPQSIFGLIGIFSGLLVASYHLLSFNILGEGNGVIINIGYFIALMINALLLGKRFSVSYFYMHRLQRDALIQNYEITQQANYLSKTKGLLEEKVSLRTKELEKVVSDLKERNNHLQQFNYIVSHNMKGPVANIIGLTNIYNRENSQDPFNPITIGKISESIHALDDVLNDLTDALEDNRKLKTPNEKVDFEDLISKIEKAILKEVEQSNIRIELDLEVTDIDSNRVYWYSILLNLISNAIKYCRQNVEPFVKISTRCEGQTLKVEVADNGMGIDLKHEHDEVFGLYKRFHDHVDGKGMGLFMVRNQVESMGGNISVQSEPNVGTTFTIVV